MPRMFWLYLAALIGAWLGMNLWSAPRIEELSGGLRLLDMRFTGYSFAEAQSFLLAIGEEGRALYLGWQLWLDMLFPPLLGVVLYYCYRWLLPGLSRILIAAVAVGSVVIDYLENAALAAMLRTGPENLTLDLVARANFWTVTKWSFASLGILVLLLGIALRMYRGVVHEQESQTPTGD